MFTVQFHSIRSIRVIFSVILITLLIHLVLFQKISAFPLDTIRVSVSSGGGQANGISSKPTLSNDGRYVVFESAASNLVAGDTNGAFDIFVHDRSTGVTSRVSVDSAGNQGNDDSETSTISNDGRYVAFHSAASNLVAGDTNGAFDIFVHDRSTGVTSRVSVDSTGGQSNGQSYSPDISADGRYVTFHSLANNLVAGDTNGMLDIFVHDRSTGVTSRVSVDSTGGQGNSNSSTAAISADGRYVAFHSLASNLVAGDTNGMLDIFVHDRSTGVTRRVSVDSTGGQGNNDSSAVAISADGRYVVFNSAASNLVAGDTNDARDIFVHDRSTGVTMRVSVDSLGNEPNSSSVWSAISSHGRYVAFESSASNLVAGDTNSVTDIFVSTLQLSPDTIGVFRPAVATFFLRNSHSGGLADIIQPFGISTDIPLVGDWNADEMDTLGVYRPADNTFYLNHQNSDGIPETAILYFAQRGVPVVGDWDGNGTDTVGLYGQGLFVLSNSISSGVPDTFIYFGDSSLDIPLAGDWDSDGRDTVGLWRASTASFYLTNLGSTGFGTVDLTINYGTSADVGFVGDWDADGVDSIGVYRPSTGDVYLRNSLSSGLPDIMFNYGIAQDIPLAGVWSLTAPDAIKTDSGSAPLFVPRQ